MAIPAKYLDLVSDEIAKAFSTEQFAEIVLAATGHELYKEYASPTDPLHRAVRRTLDRLIEDGTERWLLIQVLVSAVANEQLRRLIIKASPETLAALPKVDNGVDRALQSLALVTAAVLKPEFLPELQPSRDKIAAISEQIRTLAAFKNLHECLHALHLKLAFRSAAVDDLEGVKNIGGTCTAARAAAVPLGMAADAELVWIAELERLADGLGPAIKTANSSATQDGFGGVQRLVRLQLSRLNARIFEAADKLSLDELILVLPSVIMLEESFGQLSHAIRDLKATVMARALVHKIWQDAENELSLVEDVLSTPATSAQKLIAQNWYRLHSHVQLLASLDPGAAWAKEAMTYSDRVDTELTRETLSDTMKPSFDAFCRVLKFHFFEVDAKLKEDCGSLGKFHAPLQSIVEEIGDV